MSDIAITEQPSQPLPSTKAPKKKKSDKPTEKKRKVRNNDSQDKQKKRKKSDKEVNNKEDTPDALDAHKPVRKKRKPASTVQQQQPKKTDVVGRFWCETPLKPASRKLLKQLDSFYTDKMLEELIVQRSLRSVGGDEKPVKRDEVKSETSWSISLRCLEWLVTNYSKKHQIVLYHTEKKQRVNIYSEYLDQLNLYKRMRFDPFCRSQRIYFNWTLNDSEFPLPTTVGQLNFMKWAYITGVLEYAQINEAVIQKDMEDVLAVVQEEKRAFKNSGQKRKRKELSHAPDTYCNVYTIDTVLFGDNGGEVL